VGASAFFAVPSAKPKKERDSEGKGVRKKRKRKAKEKNANSHPGSPVLEPKDAQRGENARSLAELVMRISFVFTLALSRSRADPELGTRFF
jgi:hypothetical protein